MTTVVLSGPTARLTMESCSAYAAFQLPALSSASHVMPLSPEIRKSLILSVRSRFPFSSRNIRLPYPVRSDKSVISSTYRPIAVLSGDCTPSCPASLRLAEDVPLSLSFTVPGPFPQPESNTASMEKDTMTADILFFNFPFCNMPSPTPSHTNNHAFPGNFFSYHVISFLSKKSLKTFKFLRKNQFPPFLCFFNQIMTEQIPSGKHLYSIEHNSSPSKTALKKMILF